MTVPPPDRPPAARRGRGSAARNGELEATICEAGERLINERPFPEISVADVLAEAGVSRASFYFYFASKYALLARLAERISASVYMFGSTWFEGEGGDAREQLEESLAGAFETWSTHGPVLRALIESGAGGEETAQLWERLMGNFTEAAAVRIERDRAAGAAPPGGPDARTLAAALIWMTERALYLSIAGGEPAFQDRERSVATLTDVWWRAIYVPA